MKPRPAILLGDDPALDFLNSIATPVDVPVDWLADGDGLLSWLRQMGLVPPTVLERMRSHCPAAGLNKVAARARSLREWFRRFVQDHQGRPLRRLDLKALEPLNRVLGGGESFSQIMSVPSESGNGLELRSTHRWQSPETLLAPIAESLARFICATDFSRIKSCEGPGCTLVFADHTRRRVRRWCSMAVCGNRAKQAAHRQRRLTTRRRRGAQRRRKSAQ